MQILFAFLAYSSVCYAFQGIPKNSLQVVKQNLKEVVNTLAIGSSTLFGLTSVAVAADQVKKPKKVKVLETDSGIKYIEVKQGGGSYPADGDFVVISYTGFLPDGTVFDSTEGKGRKPLTFRMGMKQIIPGIEEVLREMRSGGEVTCTIPSKMAYGERGVCIKDGECLVPPNTNLNYAIKLKAVALSPNM
jgi:FKBP-type peptidyl-prolyl cis-trans isomerase